MRSLSSDELEAIEQRAALCFEYGDTGALRAEDVADMITEIRELWALRRHLIALNRQGMDRLAAEDAEALPDAHDGADDAAPS